MDLQHDLEFRVRFEVDDVRLSDLHASAFGYEGNKVKPWAQRLARHSLTWIGAFVNDELVGFVHACWDGGAHAFLLDTIVDPAQQRRGIGRILVQTLVTEVRESGCEWLHVDFEPHLDPFYREGCGFRRTTSGILQLSS